MKKIWQALKALVSKEFAFIKKHQDKARVAVAVVNSLKDAVESGVLDFVVRITPTDIDDRLLQKAKRILPMVLAKMAIAQLIIEQAEKNSQVTGAVISELQRRYPDGRKGFYVELAGELNVALSDGEMTFAEGVRLAQLIYEEFK